MEPRPLARDANVTAARYPWLKLAILYAAVVGGQLMVVPVALYAGPSVSIRTARITLFALLGLLATVPASLAVLPALGLPGTPMLDRLLKRESLRGELGPAFIRAMLLAIASFAVAMPMLPLRWRLLGTPHLGTASRAFTIHALGMTALSAAGAGIQEEIVFRLGLLTILVWIFARAARARAPVANHRVILWLANLAQAYVFGLMHQALGLTGSIGGFSMLGAAVDPRTMVALVLGYGALSYGIETAIIAHVLFDESIFLIVTLLPLVAR